MKYVIGQQKTTGFYLPIVFPDEIVHSSMTASFRKQKIKVIGAGFCSTDSGKIKVFGESDSLKIKPSVLDPIILQLFLGKGLSGLALQNILIMSELAKS